MILAYGSRETTKDVDAIIKPSEEGLRLAKMVAQDLGLDATWLNDDVKRFVSWEATFAPLQIQELEEAARRHLKITRASASYLLAMKCMACRLPLPGYEGDVADIKFLIQKMGIRSMEQIEEHMERFFPRDSLTPSARSTIEKLLPKGVEL